MKPGIVIKHIQDVRSFEGLKEQWDRLSSVSAARSAFLSWEWLFSWWEVYGEKKRLWLVTAWRDSELVGVAPLMLEKRIKFGFWLRVLTSLGTPQSDIGGFVHHANDVEVLHMMCDYLAGHGAEWDVLELNEFPQSGEEWNAIKRGFSRSRMPMLEEARRHFYIPLEGGWEGYKQKLPKKFRYNLGRAVRLAEEIGPVELRHSTGTGMNENVIQMIVGINRYSHFPRLYDQPREQAFLVALAQQMAGNSGFGAYLLFVGGQPVAYEYGFHFHGRFEDWRAGFDTRVASNISIGKVLAMKVIESCYDKADTEIDFLRGDEQYKLEWKPSAREFVNMRIFNTRRFIAIVAHQWLVNIKPRVKLILSQK
jgi:CelD/BcsL family acetyltransferase involved in cellulose biosynthesis